MNLLKQATVIEKQAGEWNNLWSEHGGTLTGGLLGAIAGGALAHATGKDPLIPALIGASLPTGVGMLTGLAKSIKKRRTPEEQEEIDDSKSEIVKNLLIPGYASHNLTRRALAKVNDDGAYNNMTGEVLGNAVGDAILPGANAVGALAGLAMPTRSKKEQDSYDKSTTAILLNALPGVSGYNAARRTKADYKDEDMKKESGFIQQLKELAFTPSPITKGINSLRTASTNTGRNIGSLLKSLATTPSPITKWPAQLRNASLHTGKNIGELLKTLLLR